MSGVASPAWSQSQVSDAKPSDGTSAPDCDSALDLSTTLSLRDLDIGWTLDAVVLPDLRDEDGLRARAHGVIEAALRSGRLSAPGGTVDRHGRLVPALLDADCRPVQERLLEQGLARVRPTGTPGDLTRLFAAETRARSRRLGLWQQARYRVFAVHSGAAWRPWPRGDFVLVEGRVIAVARVRERIFLNFGPDWRTDFTAVIDSPSAFKRSGALESVLSAEGRVVRVRGRLTWWNGPSVGLAFPQQIEWLEDHEEGATDTGDGRRQIAAGSRAKVGTVISDGLRFHSESD